MTAPAALLPPASSDPWEIAQSLTSAARRPLDADIIRRLWTPATCPEELLPYLAWGLGLEIWRDDWIEAKKRDVVARIWQLKSRKTTPAGIRDYLALVDAELVGMRRPRDIVFAVDPWSDEERAAIEAAMPQLHIYAHARSFPVWAGMSFAGSFAADWDCATQSDAAERYAERAVYVVDGVETPCTVRGIDGPLDASLRVELARSGDVARCFADRWTVDWGALIDNDAETQVISITPDRSAASFAVPTGLVPVTVRPEPIVETVVAGGDMAFADHCWAGAATLYIDDADKHVYDRLRFFDPRRPPVRGQAFSFCDWSQFGTEPYTAELTISVRTEGVPWGLPGPLGLGVVHDPDFTSVFDALAAVSVAQATRDDILVSLRTFEPIAFAPALSFGDWEFGDYRKVIQ
ncbi:phage tail protein I [Methylosinus sp. Sm6]|uniref:phage tail protein I n=1 Tax=Methylosinus sp. Sm6 TaxID=2866948 RepID=UPI001C993355|nr:phage tail protein I [Methylosinus sp. Sm6]MBY6243739.1 phage tail protein I [Methylosinus sp. Sm6]